MNSTGRIQFLSRILFLAMLNAIAILRIDGIFTLK